MSEAHKKQHVYLSLQPSEMAVFQSAANIYAAYIAAGKVVEGQENTFMQKAIKEAIQIAYQVDQYVLSDEESDRDIFTS